jgi:hypothetical protein
LFYSLKLQFRAINFSSLNRHNSGEQYSSLCTVCVGCPTTQPAPTLHTVK